MSTRGSPVSEPAPEEKVDRRRLNGQATRDRMVAEAELLFAERGFDGASTRALADAGGAEVAMIVYHFGSKLGLYREVMIRRAETLNARRLQELDEVLESSRGKPNLAQIVHALVASNIRMRTDAALGGLPVARLIARELIDPANSARHTISDMFDALAARFVQAIQLSLPEASVEAVHWSYHFAISAMVQTMANVNRLEELSQGVCDASDSEAVIDRLVPFIVGGMRACVAQHKKLAKAAVAAPKVRRKTAAAAGGAPPRKTGTLRKRGNRPD